MICGACLGFLMAGLSLRQMLRRLDRESSARVRRSADKENILVAESSPGQKLKSAILLTVVVMLVGWGLCFFPAHSLRGMSGVGWMSLAAVSCLIPDGLLFAFQGFRFFGTKPQS